MASERPFIAVGMAVLTISDTRGMADDRSGAVLAGRVEGIGHRLIERAIVRDEPSEITEQLRAWIASPDISVILTTGGTGVTARDVTPETVRELFEKEIPGFGELFRQISFRHIGASTIQSRALAGVAGATYIFCLPGSPGACRDAWDEILASQLDSRTRPCNFIELLPRLAR